MAITTTLVTSGSDGWETNPDPSNFTTASISPGANCALVLCIAAVQSDDTVGEQNDDLFTTGHTVVSSASGPTWTKQSNAAPGGGDYIYHSVVWTATIGGSDPGSFTVTAEWVGGGSGVGAGAHAYSIHKCTGHDTTTTFAGAATQANQAGDGAVTLTLGASPATDDVTIALSGADATTGGGATFGTGTWTETAEGTSAKEVTWNTGYRTASTSSSVPWSDVQTGTGNFTSAQAAIIVKVDAGGGSFTGTVAVTLDGATSSASGTVTNPPSTVMSLYPTRSGLRLG